MQNYSTHHELRCSQQPNVQTPLSLIPSSLKISANNAGKSHVRRQGPKRKTETEKE